MDDLEQALIQEAQNLESIDAATDLEIELLQWEDWTKGITEIQEEDDIEQFVKFYYESSERSTDDLEDELKKLEGQIPKFTESISNLTDETSEDTHVAFFISSFWFQDLSNITEIISGKMDMDENIENTLCEYTSDTYKTYVTPISPIFSLDLYI